LSFRHHLRHAAAILLAVAAFALPGAWAWAQGQPTVDTYRQSVQPSELVPGADRFGATRPDVPAMPALKGEQLLGYVYLTSQIVNTNGYSGKPIHTLVGLDATGTIVGLKLMAHDEPIVLIGIAEQRIVDSIKPFIGYNPLTAGAAGHGAPKADIVSGATVTVLVIGESIVRSAVRVARLLHLGSDSGPAGALGAQRAVDANAGRIEGWDALLADGSIGRLQLTVGDVNRAFEATGNAQAIKRPQPGAPDAPFIDLYVAQVSQPAIGRSLLGESEFAAVQQMLAPGQQAILVAGEGVYSFKGSGYVRGGIFDRIELAQGTETIRFTDRLHRRVGALLAKGAPRLREVDIFVVPQGVEFDPVAPWHLQLLVQRAIGALDKAFVSFDLAYQLPVKYTRVTGEQETGVQARPTGAAAPVAPQAVSAAPVDRLAGKATASGGSRDIGQDEPAPLWQRIWQSKLAAIAVLAVMLAVLTGIFFFQHWFTAREALFDRVRLVYLAVTLLWLGWVAHAQLSVVNVLTFFSALRADFHWEAFLIDPLIFILWTSVAAALLFWGRGPFCGWLCPFGALQEFANRIAKALRIPQLKVPWGLHERLVPIKYIIFLGLFGVSLGSLALAETLAEIEPFKTAIVLHFMRQWWFVAFALLVLLPGLFIERFFCRYMCPLGAALAIPGRMRMFEWLRRYRDCGNPCQRCFHECPVEAIHPEGHINPNECIGCLHCQVLYHHDRKCPVMIQRRLKREKREALRAATAPAGGAVALQVRQRKSDLPGFT